MSDFRFELRTWTEVRSNYSSMLLCFFDNYYSFWMVLIKNISLIRMKLLPLTFDN